MEFAVDRGIGMIVIQTPALKNTIRLVVLLVATIALLYFFLRNSDPAEVMEQLRSLDPFWLAVALLTNFTALLSRAARWRIILRPSDPPPFYPTFFATAVGFLSSAVLPIRAGDVIRPALLSRRTDIRFSSALGTVVIEKLLDTTSVLVLFIGFVMTVGRHFFDDPRIGSKAGIVMTLGVGAGVLLGVMVTIVVALLVLRERARDLIERLTGRFSVRLQSGAISFYESFLRAFRLARDRKAFVRVLLLTASVWLCLTGQFYFVSLAMGRPLPYSASFLVTGFSILGMMIPTPGGVGGFHKACQIALTTFYMFTVSESVATAVIFHIVGTLPVLVTGATLLIREGVSLAQIARIGEKVEE